MFNKKLKISILSILSLGWSIISYSQVGDLSIDNFSIDFTGSGPNGTPYVEGEADSDQKVYTIRYHDETGVIPRRDDNPNPLPPYSIHQTLQHFSFSFEVTNNKPSTQKVYYAIYYQNESYKFEGDESRTANNFYGSWGYNEKNAVWTHQVEVDPNVTETITDKFKIRGNPRNDCEFAYDPLNCSDWGDNTETTLSTRDWHMDRWKRIPIPGEYNFILVVTTNTTTAESYKLDIRKKKVDNQGNMYHVSPFLLTSNTTDDIKVVTTPQTLKVVIKPDLSEPVANGSQQGNTRSIFEEYERKNVCKDTNLSSTVLTTEPELLVDKTGIKNIHLVTDWESYTQEDYYWNKHFFSYSNPDLGEDEDKLEMVYVNLNYNDGNGGRANAQGNDYTDGSIILSNPANDCDDCMEDFTKCKKGLAGMRSRSRLLYGKYTGKIKYPSLLNAHNVWSGVANGFWLIASETSGYSYCENATEELFEIDIEIFPTTIPQHGDYNDDGLFLKETAPTKQYDVSSWFLNSGNPPVENDLIRMLISYHDKKCNPLDPNLQLPLGSQPVNYISGETGTWVDCPEDANCSENGNDMDAGQPDNTIRWKRGGDGFNGEAIHSGRTISQSEILGDQPYFYYQIERRPDKIIYRVGPTLESLILVGYITEDYVRMDPHPVAFYISQELLGCGFADPRVNNQGFLPFWNHTLEGYVFDVIIE